LREKMVPGSPFSLRRLFTAPFSQSEHHQGGECAKITSYKYKTALRQDRKGASMRKAPQSG
jgi:hypothetical protein